MDGHQFDTLTRSITQRLSRRLTFKALTAGLAAGALSQLDVEPADAARCQKPGKSCQRRRGKPQPRCCAGSVCRGNRCQCKRGRQQCGNKCITRRQCCRNSDCANNQICRNNRCRCRNGRKLCNDTCIANEQCCTDADCGIDQVCNNRNTCVAATCVENEDCASGACACTQEDREIAPGANTCQQRRFEQDFSSSLNGWNAYSADGKYLPPSTDGTMTLENGYAVIKPGVFDPDEELTAMSTMGGYGNVWPKGGFTTELDIYLDTEFAEPNTHFSYTVSARNKSCAFQNEFFMNGGTGGGDQAGKYCVSAHDGGATTIPCTHPDHFEVPESGWYRFRHEFRNNNGTLQVIMRLHDMNDVALKTWVVSHPNDTIGPSGNVGGNGYQWITKQHFPELRIRNSRRVTHFG